MFGPLSFPSSLWGSEESGDMKLSPCILCDEKFDMCFDREDFMNHILESHSAIIKDCDCIIDLAGYVDYWKQKFKSVSIKDICCPLEAKDNNETGTPCYILSDSIKEDKDLREKLNKQALEKALERQKIEREDKQFKRRCLFCWHDIEPTRAVYLSHLSSSHNLQLGKPDNLVFIDKYLDVIEHKIENLKCIFCEKTFKDRNVLKEHMRKKLHKRVNPKNPIYDQFYMINYLTPGISNKKLRERKRRKSVDDDDDDCDWSDWKEESCEPIVCLFCLDNFHSWDSVLQHLMKDHSFDFKALCSELDFYEQIKMVNYIRRQVYRNQCIICDEILSDRKELLSHMTQEKHFLKPPKVKWDQPEYFFPTYENDGFLYHLDDSGETFDSEEEKRLCNKDAMSNLFINQEKCLPCLFCDFTHQVGDNLLNHMYDEHKFDYNEYTRPLNFMDRVKLINYTKNQIQNKLCIECDQKFDDLGSLAQHMKEMNHYSTPSKSQWQHVRFSCDNVPEKSSNVHENTVDYLYALESLNNIKKDLDIEKEVKENCFSDCDEDAVPIICLFCDNESSSWTQVISHLETSHKFSYIKLTSTMSFYDQVKMVTYLRKMIKKSTCPVCEVVCKKEDLLKHLETQNHFAIPPKELWDKSEYYPAGFAGDPFLSELNVHHATDTLVVAPNNELDNVTDNAEDNKLNDEDSGSDWGDWDEEMKIPVTCLLCKDVSQNWVDVHNHMKNKHNFSYHEISINLEFYDQVKLINYLRSQVALKRCFVCDKSFESNDDLLEHYSVENHLQLPDKQLWNKDKFFQPFMENDGFLAHIDDGDSDDDI